MRILRQEDTAIHPDGRNIRNTDAARREECPEPEPASEALSSSGACDLCGNGEDRQPIWLRVINVSYWVVMASVRNVYVRCLCCRRCRERIASLRRFRLYCLLAMFLVFPVGCLIYLPLGAKQPSETTPLETALAIGILIGIFAIFVSMPVLMALGGKVRMRRILSPAADVRLRELTGVRRWGLSNFTIVKAPKDNGPRMRM